MAQTGTIEKIFASLGTVNHIAAEFDETERENVRQAMESAERYITDMDDRLSVFKPDSEVSRINLNAGESDTLVGRDTFDLLRLCVEYGGLTDGAFDITTKPLTDGGGEAAEIDYRDIILDRKRLSVRLRKRGQGIHLGGIAKGYAADSVADILKRGGVRQAMINLGGTVRCLGCSRRVGIRNPFTTGGAAASIEIGEETAATSGLYERGRHIFDPVSGRAAETDIASVTAIGKNGAAADAAATACMVVGFRQGIELLGRLGLEGIFILRDGRIFSTEHIRTHIRTA